MVSMPRLQLAQMFRARFGADRAVGREPEREAAPAGEGWEAEASMGNDRDKSMANGKSKDPIPPVPQAAKGRLRLPPGLVEEAAKMLFDFFEDQGARARKVPPIPWGSLKPRYQMMWLTMTRLVLEMGATVILHEAHAYLEASNGDMGAAFAKALRRYMTDVLGMSLTQDGST